MNVDFTKVVPSAEFVGEDDEETQLVREMVEDARRYVTSFRWCDALRADYVGIAIGRVVAVILAQIVPAEEGVDEWLWIVVGDLPPAYLVTDDAPNPACALDAYVELMREWVDAVRERRPVDDLIPVTTAGGAEPVSPTRENAEMLEWRLRFLEEKVLADYAEDLEDE